jgi:hypothetical protein
MRTLLFLSAVAAATVACDFHIGGETNGAHGNAHFTYASCFLGCTTTTPMMLSDKEDVSVSGSIPDGVSALMTAPQIVSIKSASRSCCHSDADAGSVCRTLALGDTCAERETATLDIVVTAAAVGSSDLVIKKSRSRSRRRLRSRSGATRTGRTGSLTAAPSPSQTNLRAR